MSQIAQQNWETSYADKAVTYVADPQNPNHLEQILHFKEVTCVDYS